MVFRTFCKWPWLLWNCSLTARAEDEKEVNICLCFDPCFVPNAPRNIALGNQRRCEPRPRPSARRLSFVISSDGHSDLLIVLPGLLEDPGHGLMEMR